MKKDRIIFWVTTGMIFLFEGVMPALTSQSEMAKEGIRHLGYPDYFGVMLAFFKVAGALALIVPQIPGRIKEWAYAGFAFDFIAALVSNWAINGPKPMTFSPVVAMVILILSYVYYHKLIDKKTA
jgi:Na+/melibiose symporter-like transporter